MAFFRSFKQNTVTILEDKNGRAEDGTTLEVGSPLLIADTADTGLSFHLESWSEKASYQLSDFGQSTNSDCSTQVLLLKSPTHELKTPLDAFELLGHRIRDGTTAWGAALPTIGESIYTELYWEWLEDVLCRNPNTLKNAGLYDAVFASLFSYDRFAPVIRAFCERWCPATNTLHTLRGEMSISLWDLYRLGGLSITGDFYNEVTPSEASFAQKSMNESTFNICRYLFLVYHRLHRESKSKDGVKISSWVKYWYKGPLIYDRPPRKNVRNKHQGPQTDHDPIGIIKAAARRSSREQAVFDNLGVDRAMIEKLNLAAFLSCWLCKFVLPKDDTSLIRPGVFRAASRMALGVRYSLAIPVLASIYKGLGNISCDPKNCSIALPFHYVYAWLGEYFYTHHMRSLDKSTPLMARFSGGRSARLFDDAAVDELFEDCEKIKMNRFAKAFENPRCFNDDGSLSRDELSYFISLRSGYVSSRQENSYIVQPYHPHRFSRQFGYVQHIPGVLINDICEGPLSVVYANWFSCTRAKTLSTVTLPTNDNLRSSNVTRDYITWWLSVYHSGKASAMKTTKELRQTLSKSSKSKKNMVCPRVDSALYEKSNFRSPEVACSSTIPAVVAPLLQHVDQDLKNRLADDLGKDEDVADSQDDLLTVNELKGQFPCLKKRVVLDRDDNEVNFKHQKRDPENVDHDLDDSFPIDVLRGGIIEDIQLPPKGRLDPLPTSWDNDGTITVPIENISQPIKALSNGLQGSSTKPLSQKPLGDACTPAYSIAQPSPGCAEETNRHLMSIIMRGIKSILTKTRPEELPNLTSDINKLFSNLKALEVEAPFLQAKARALMKCALDYNSSRSIFSQKLSVEVQNNRLAAVSSSLSVAESGHKAEIARRQDVFYLINSAKVRLEELKKEQRDLEANIDNLTQSFPEIDACISDHLNEMIRLKKERTEIIAAPVLSAGDDEKLKILLKNYEDQVAELRNMIWE